MTPLRIAIVVPGRLHAFELAAALQKQGHEVYVYSNYPVSEALKFGLNPRTYRSNVPNRILLRLWLSLPVISKFDSLRDRVVCGWFDRWASNRLEKDLPFDAIHVFSGVAYRTLGLAKTTGIYAELVRGSAHIETQTALLKSEAKRSGGVADIPSTWMRSREKMEYELADHIAVLSQFALKSFLVESKDKFTDKLHIMPLGIDMKMFDPADGVLQKRLERVLGGARLKVLMVGGFSAQKGAADFIRVAASLADEMDFCFVGSTEDEWKRRCLAEAPAVSFIDRVEQEQLPDIYAQNDIFYFPTIQDGFAMVIAQALASGLCVIASENSAAPDLLENARTGYVIPAQQSDFSINLLRELNGQRRKLAEIIKASHCSVESRHWDDVAAGFAENVYRERDIA